MATPKKKPVKKNDVTKKIKERYNVTAREARDIVTAVSTLYKTPMTFTKKPLKRVKPDLHSKAVSNLKTQIKETAVAAKTGKRGTTSLEVRSSNPKNQFDVRTSKEPKQRPQKNSKKIKRNK
jgi:hypothetical protein